MEATTLRAAGWDVAVVCPTGRGFETRFEVVEGVRIFRHALPTEGNGLAGYLREYTSALWAESRLARRAWRQLRFDVVHICNPPDLLFLVAGWYKVVHRARIVFDHHDIMPELYEAKFGRRDLAYGLVRAAERMTFAAADMVIATNESYRRVALTRGRKDPDRVVVIRSAPELSRFRLVESDSACRRGRRFLVGYVGVMGPQEGLDYLLRAVEIIVNAKRRTDISFTLIGDGPSLPSLQHMAERLGVSDYISFTGRVSDEELIRHLSSCDVCVNPDPLTPFNDASSMNKILEYMALGKPVVQFDLTEGRRSAGSASAYARPNDERHLAETILELLDDEDARVRMGREGLRRMTVELEWRYQAPRLVEAYDRLLEMRAHRTDRNSE